MRAPRISVLLPVRDAGRTLGACLDSLAAQTLADHEVVAVDDGSSDESRACLRERSARDPRIRLLEASGCGLVAALTQALEAARAPLAARMDADDVAHPERLRLQAERLENDTSVDVLGSRVTLGARPGAAPGQGMRSYVAWVNGLMGHEQMARDRFVESPIVHPSVAMRTAALRRLGYRGFDGPEDYDLWLRAFEAGLRFAKLEAALVEWRDSPRRLTRTDVRYSPAAFRRLKVEALSRGPLSGRSAVVWGAGPVGKAFARALQGAGRRVAGFVEVDTRKIGETIHGAPVVAVGDACGFRGVLHLAAVARPGARERIRAEAARLGLVDGIDLVAVA